jgi:hypothetical protein
MTILFSEDFGSTPYTLKDGQVSPNGKIKCVYNGYGFVKVDKITDPKNGRDGSCLHFKPQVNNQSTSACLVSVEKEFTDFDETFYMRTVEQTKTNPENWETGWFMWGYTDNTHHYYCAIKKNGGIEVGKKDYVKIGTNQIKTPDGKITNVSNQDQQVFLNTSASVSFGLNKWFKIRLIVKGISIKIYVDNILKVNILDDGKTGSWLGKPVTFQRSAQMAKGKTCFYGEDAYVQVDNVVVNSV